MKIVLATALLVICFSFSAKAAEDGHGAAGHKHLAMFVGAGKEETPGHKHDATAIGFEFEYRLNDDWGVGAVVESLDVEHRGNVVLVVPFSYHFSGFRAFAGPGYEIKQNIRKDKWLLRLGLGYEFHLNEHWTVAPRR